MQSLTNDLTEFTLDEFPQLDAFHIAQLGEPLMHLGVELGSDVFTFEGHELGARLRAAYLPREIGAQVYARNWFPSFGRDGLDMGSHIWRNPPGAIAPRPNMALSNRFASAGGQLAREDGLSASDINCAIEGFCAHGRGIYYLSSKDCNTQCSWTLDYLLSSVPPMNLANRIKQLREGKEWTQAKLAEVAKVSQQLIAKIETGNVLESRKLPKIASAFGMTVDELLGATTPRATQKQDELTDDENDLLNAYRSASPLGRQAIKSAALLGVAESQNLHSTAKIKQWERRVRDDPASISDSGKGKQKKLRGPR